MTRIMVAAFLAMTTLAAAETQVAVINDPDGFTNVRREPATDSAVIDKINDGQRFITTGGGEDWWEVYSPSGKRGYVHKSRIKVLSGEPLPRMTFSKADVVKSAREVPEFQEHARPYPKLVEAAVAGKPDDLKKFYEAPRTLELDGAGAEIHTALMWEVFHVVGDQAFRDFLAAQDKELVRDLATDFRSGFVSYPIEEPEPYLQQHFPKSWDILEAYALEPATEPARQQ